MIKIALNFLKSCNCHQILSSWHQWLLEFRECLSSWHHRHLGFGECLSSWHHRLHYSAVHVGQSTRAVFRILNIKQNLPFFFLFFKIGYFPIGKPRALAGPQGPQEPPRGSQGPQEPPRGKATEGQIPVRDYPVTIP